MPVPKYAIVDWQIVKQVWRAENGFPAPKKLIMADDTLTADHAYQLACEGCGILWQGDFQLARQLLQAMTRRCDRSVQKSKKEVSPEQAFHLHRQAQSQRARILSKLLISLNADYTVSLKRAPNIVEACVEAYDAANVDSIVSLRELLGVIGAHEWRKKGVMIAELGDKIHPHYGVFSPIRGEYLSLVANTILPDTSLAFDIGTGTGVLAAILAKRGVQKIVATDQDPRALNCARENVQRLGYTNQIDVIQADLFPEGKAPLIVCNPPWVPARPGSPIEHAIYDPDSRMLRGFLAGLSEHLTDHGEGWLILSDFAEHLGLRSRDQLLAWIDQAGLKVIDRIDVKPVHPKVMDKTDALHQARAAEITSLWKLSVSHF